MPLPPAADVRPVPASGRFLGLGLAAALLVGCATQPMTVVDAVPAPPPSCEASVVLRTTFAFDSYRVPPAGQFEVAQLANSMLAPPLNTARTFDINGHTDVVGRLGYNMGLSALRAGAVVDALIARGVPRERLRAQGFGPLQLIDPVNPRSGANRRVEVVANYC